MSGAGVLNVLGVGANEAPSGWGQEPLQDAYRTGAICWYVVADQALSVADLLDSGRTFGLLSSSRSLAEAACRSAYLLTDDVDPPYAYAG